MNPQELGVATLHTRVECWECDFNGHWNTRYYGRSFQAAAELIAERAGRVDVAYPDVRHFRFHRELLVASTIENRSARLVSDDQLNDAVVHWMLCDGEVAATAIDVQTQSVELPEVSPEDVAFALPRGVGFAVEPQWPDSMPTSTEVLLGPVRPAVFDHRGHMLYDELLSYASVASNYQMEYFGFTPQYTDQNKISRMAVELRVMRYATPAVGASLRATSRMMVTSPKTFNAHHQVETLDGQRVATMEFCLLTVSTETRRAVPVPQLLLETCSPVA